MFLVNHGYKVGGGQGSSTRREVLCERLNNKITNLGIYRGTISALLPTQSKELATSLQRESKNKNQQQ
jgi:hypothetical protein